MCLVQSLPTLNASLNAIALILLSAGFLCIKRGLRKAHQALMMSAFGVSVVCLITYVAHKILVKGVHTPFQGEGFWAMVYYPMLVSHILLAIAIVPLVIVTLNHALQGRLDRHRAWARWAFPLWYYVSVTGVLVYCFLYVWF